MILEELDAANGVDKKGKKGIKSAGIRFNDDIDLNLEFDNLDGIKSNKKQKHGKHEDHIKVTGIKDVTNEDKITVQDINKDDKIDQGSDVVTVHSDRLDEELEVSDTIENKHEEKSVPVDEAQVATTGDNSKHEGDRVITSKERKKQIKEDRKKTIFTKICKFVFYIIIFLSVFVLIRKMLHLLGFIEIKKEYVNPNTDTNTMNSNSNSSVELKTTNNKNE